MTKKKGTDITFTNKDGQTFTLEEIRGLQEKDVIKKSLQGEISTHVLYKKPVKPRERSKKSDKSPVRHVPKQEYIMEKYPLLKECKSLTEKVVALFLSGDKFTAETMTEYAGGKKQSIYAAISKATLSPFGGWIEKTVHKGKRTYQYKGEVKDLKKAIKMVLGKKTKVKPTHKRVSDELAEKLLKAEADNKTYSLEIDGLLKEVDRLTNELREKEKPDVEYVSTRRAITIKSQEDTVGLSEFLSYCVKHNMKIKLTIE